MENVVGNRHKLHPCIKHERYRGSSQIKFSDGDPDSSRPWKTTNQVHNPVAIIQNVYQKLRVNDVRPCA